MAIQEEKHSIITPIGVYAYNYKTNATNLYPFNRIIGDIEVTDNSIYMTWKKDVEDSRAMYVQDNNYKDSYFIVRLTKDFEYPVVIYKGINYIGQDKNGNEISWYGGIPKNIEVIGNYVYFNNLLVYSDVERVSTDGKEITNLNEFWKYEVKEENDSDYKYTIGDFTKDLRN